MAGIFTSIVRVGTKVGTKVATRIKPTHVEKGSPDKEPLLRGHGSWSAGLSNDSTTLGKAGKANTIPDPAGLGHDLKLGGTATRTGRVRHAAGKSYQFARTKISQGYAGAKHAALNPGDTFRRSWQGSKNIASGMVSEFQGMGTLGKIATVGGIASVPISMMG